MKAGSASVRISATDLSNHLVCRHLTALDLAVATGARPAANWHSPDAWVLQQLGLMHENAYVADLSAQGFSTVNLRDVMDERRVLAATADAMRSGVDIIIQGGLEAGRWFGRPDWDLVRDQGVGGSNPLSPTIYFQAVTRLQNPGKFSP